MEDCYAIPMELCSGFSIKLSLKPSTVVDRVSTNQRLTPKFAVESFEVQEHKTTHKSLSIIMQFS